MKGTANANDRVAAARKTKRPTNSSTNRKSKASAQGSTAAVRATRKPANRKARQSVNNTNNASAPKRRKATATIQQRRKEAVKIHVTHRVAPKLTETQTLSRFSPETQQLLPTTQSPDKWTIGDILLALASIVSIFLLGWMVGRL